MEKEAAQVGLEPEPIVSKLTRSKDAGDITFFVADGTEMIRLAANGDIYVKGRLVERDEEVIAGFKNWLSGVGCLNGRG